MDDDLTPLTNREHELLTYLEQFYLMQGSLPTAEVTEAAGVCSPKFFADCFKKQKFREAVLVRGLSLRGLDGSPGAGVLTEQQLVVANAMLDLRDNRSQKKKLTEYGISTAKWEAWLRDPVFQNYLRTRAENLLGDNLHESHLALVDRVRTGDINAIKYFNEITGRYTPAANDKADVSAVLFGVVEILQKHLKDANVLSAIADDLLALGARHGVGGNQRNHIPGPRQAYLSPSPVGTTLVLESGI